MTLNGGGRYRPPPFFYLPIIAEGIKWTVLFIGFLYSLFYVLFKVYKITNVNC